MKNKSIRNIVLLSLTGVMSLGIIIANPKTGVIPEKDLTALKAETSTGKFYSDYATQADCEVAAEAVDEQVAEESMVLLKNKDNLLPFKGVKRITVFGKNSINPSGTGTNSPFSSGTALEKMDIYDGLEGAGYTVNPAMKAFYEDNARSGEGRGSGSMFGGSSGTYISETPASDYDASVTGSFHLYGDAAIIQITRVAGEGQDSDTYNVKDHASDADNTNHYLQLSQNEKDMVALAEKYFDKIVFVINSPMAMQIGELKDDDKIGAILWAGIPGTVGFMAVGKILDGEVNPSGHLVDTWARDFTKDPTFQNFGDNQQSNSGNENYGVRGTDGAEIQVTSSGWGGVTKAVIPALEYEEGIYVGYRYYETMDALQKTAGTTDWFDKNVAYPFGYGLSYTDFTTSVESVKALDKNGAAVVGLDTAEKIEAKVKVENNGDAAGKHVVEMYYKAPYITGGIEKSEAVLGAFDKTKMLQPGESQEITLDLYVQDMASYDFSDANGNSHKGYELDLGNYNVSIRSDSHNVIGSAASFALAATKNFDTDRITGKTVQNVFSDSASYYYSLPTDKDIVMEQMTRKNGATGFKVSAPTTADYTVKDGSKIEYNITHVFNIDDLEDGTREIPVKTAADATAAGISQAASTSDPNRVCKVQLKDMMNVPKTDTAKWTAFLNQLTWTELLTIVGNGGWSEAAVPSIGKPRVVDHDSPEGWDFGDSVTYPGGVGLASTWNVDLAKTYGEMIGNEGFWEGCYAWYGPAMDTHRSPFGGRNGQYYSEDGLIAGKIAASEIKGVHSKGLVTYLKHFALNDQETSRTGIITYATEQAIREIYCKSFQIAVEEGGSDGIMSSYNRIGLVGNDCNYNLLVSILRNEWGFNGSVVSDAGGASSSAAYQNRNIGQAGGNDLALSSNDPSAYDAQWSDTDGVPEYTGADGTKGKKTYTTWFAIRTAAENLLFNCANGKTFDNQLDFSTFKDDATLTAMKDVAYTKSIAADATKLGTSTVRYEVTGGALPAGMTLSAAGVISGTASTTGKYTFTVTLHADNYITRTATYTLAINDAFTYAGSDLTKAAVGVDFSGQISSTQVTTDNYKTVTYNLADGSSLPDGLDMDKTGKITGTPAVAGTYTFTINVDATTETAGSSSGTTTTHHSFTQTFTIVIAAKTYAVTFKSGADTIATVNVNSGETVAVPANPVKDGYIFTGWFTDDACTKAADFSKGVTANASYYAGWAQEYVPAETTGEINSAADSINSGVSSQIAGVNANVSSAAATASDAQTAAKKANSVGVTGIVVGVVGIIVGACGVVLALMAKKKPM